MISAPFSRVVLAPILDQQSFKLERRSSSSGEGAFGANNCAQNAPRGIPRSPKYQDGCEPNRKRRLGRFTRIIHCELERIGTGTVFFSAWLGNVRQDIGEKMNKIMDPPLFLDPISQSDQKSLCAKNKKTTPTTPWTASSLSLLWKQDCKVVLHRI